MKKNDWTQLGPDVIRLRHEGLTRKEICIQLNVTPDALKHFIKQLDHPAPRRARELIHPIKPKAPHGPPQKMTAEQNAQLSALWSEGHTASEIGRLMNVSKNAVIGRVHRLGLPGRPSPIRRGAEPSETHQDSPSVSATAQLALPEPATALVMLPAHIEPDPIEPEVIAPPVAIVRDDPARDTPAQIEPAPTDPAIVPPQPAPTSHLRIVPKPTHSFSRACCWPIGEPGAKTFRFCDAAEVVEGKPYCLEHCQRAYVNFGRGGLMKAA